MLMLVTAVYIVTGLLVSTAVGYIVVTQLNSCPLPVHLLYTADTQLCHHHDWGNACKANALD